MRGVVRGIEVLIAMLRNGRELIPEVVWRPWPLSASLMSTQPPKGKMFQFNPA
jgi:hypothetical protein